jgi:predicted transcriptional regulator
MPTKKKTISVRLDPKLAKRLEKLARDSERSVSWHINRLVEDNIDYVEEELAAIKRGMEDHKQGRHEDAETYFARLFAEIEERKAASARRAG